MKKGPSGWHLHPYEMAVCGFKNAGKTTLLQKLVAILERRGIVAGCLKSDAHGFDMDRPGTDTYLMRAAGARTVAITDSRSSAWLIDHAAGVADQTLLEQAYNSAHVLLIEGRKDSPLPKILLWDERGEMEARLAGSGDDTATAIVGFPAVADAARARARAMGLPYWDRDQSEEIAAHILEFWKRREPPLRGLILAGGASSRMGTDKSLMRYGDRPPEPQRLAALLAPLCHSVHLSCRADQNVPGFEAGGNANGIPIVMPDAYLNMGPLGGMLTAFDADPRAAWLVVSCDLPLLTEHDLAYLVERRNSFALGTAPTTLWDGAEMPEPLCAIWEPKARPRLLGLLASGVKCPRWALRAGGAQYVTPPDRQAFLNANHPDDRRQALEILQRSGHA